MFVRRKKKLRSDETFSDDTQYYGRRKFLPNTECSYSVFHRFRQAKFAYGDLILSSEPIFVTAQAAT